MLKVLWGWFGLTVVAPRWGGGGGLEEHYSQYPLGCRACLLRLGLQTWLVSLVLGLERKLVFLGVYRCSEISLAFYVALQLAAKLGL